MLAAVGQESERTPHMPSVRATRESKRVLSNEDEGEVTRKEAEAGGWLRSRPQVLHLKGE